jgi:hypothetical protein
MQGLGAYTTRNAPAPENGDEIVAGPIEPLVTSSNSHIILSACDARDTRDLVS